MTDADSLSQKEYEHNQKNMKIVAKTGLDLAQRFTVSEKEFSLKDALLTTLNWLAPIAKLLGEKYEQSLAQMISKVNDPTKLPSQKILTALKASGKPYQTYFFEYGKALYNQTYSHLNTEKIDKFKAQVEDSLHKLEIIENQPQIPFKEYLDNYFKF